MNYTTPNKVLTKLPNSIRKTEDKNDLIAMIIQGYQELELPQDKNYIEDIVTTTSHNFIIPNNYNGIVSINLIVQREDNIVEYSPVYPTNINSSLCKDERRCKDCQYTYTISNRNVKLPVKEATYEIIYDQLYSESLLIPDDPNLIKYLVAFTVRQIIYDRALQNDVSQNMLQYTDLEMNTLYRKARGIMLMKSIRIENYRQNLLPINMTYDEFNNRYYTN